jgi:hypothetical protein
MRSSRSIALVIMACGFLATPYSISAAAAAAAAAAADPASQPATKPVDKTDPDIIQWRFHCDLEDGRRFISDGSLLLESRYLPNVAIPEKSVPAQGAQRLLESETDKEFGLDDLTQKAANGHYAAPSGIQLNRKYIKRLRESRMKGTVRFRGKGLNDPVLILDEQKVVGVMMPIKS